MGGFDIFVTYPHGKHSQEDNYRWTMDMVHRLRGIHPLLANFSEGGMSLEEAMAQPLLHEFSFADWQNLYARDDDGPWGPYHVGVGLGFWNRIMGEDSCRLSFKYNCSYPGNRNDVMLTDMPVALFEPELLDAIMVAMIESFHGDRAEYAWLNSGKTPRFLHYTLWLRGEDRAFPTGDDVGRFEPEHPPAPVCESWHGGTRYRWPEHAPRLLAQKFASEADEGDAD